MNWWVLYENSNSALLKMRMGNLNMAAGCECFVLGEEHKSNVYYVMLCLAQLSFRDKSYYWIIVEKRTLKIKLNFMHNKNSNTLC